MKKHIAFIGLATLAACGSTANLAPTTLSAATGSAGGTLSGSVAASANEGDAMIVTVAGTNLGSLTRQAILDTGTFRGAGNANGTSPFFQLAHSGETSTGEMSASMAASADNAPTGLLQAASFARNGTTAMPASGTANFAGSYVGSWAGETGFYSMYMVKGDAALTADFGASTISGAITNRILQRSDGATNASNTFQDIALGSATIDANGAFSGTATGGAYDPDISGGVTDVSGSWTGLVGGATGNQVAGAVQLDKLYDNYNGGGVVPHVFEYGVFLAE